MSCAETIEFVELSEWVLLPCVDLLRVLKICLMSATPESPDVHQYRLAPARFARVRRRMITALAVFAPFFLALVWYLDARLDSRRNFFDFVGLPAVLGYLGYSALRRERRKWDSFVLELRRDRLIRTLRDFPELEIAPGEVTTIAEYRRGVHIRTNSRRKALAVSTDLLDFDDFRNRLAAWAPMAKVVQPTSTSRTSIVGIASLLWCLLIFGGPLYLMYTPHHELILPLGFGLFIGMAVTIWYFHCSPDMPASTQKTAWVLLLLPLLATIVRLTETR